jgi:hypothetical protein
MSTWQLRAFHRATKTCAKSTLPLLRETTHQAPKQTKGSRRDRSSQIQVMFRYLFKIVFPGCMLTLTVGGTIVEGDFGGRGVLS